MQTITDIFASTFFGGKKLEKAEFLAFKQANNVRFSKRYKRLFFAFQFLKVREASPTVSGPLLKLATPTFRFTHIAFPLSGPLVLSWSFSHSFRSTSKACNSPLFGSLIKLAPLSGSLLILCIFYSYKFCEHLEGF